MPHSFPRCYFLLGKSLLASFRASSLVQAAAALDNITKNVLQSYETDQAAVTDHIPEWYVYKYIV